MIFPRTCRKGETENTRSPPFGKNVRRRPTLPHPHECSTIGAGGLSFRVRNETGRFPTAITTETLIKQPHNQPTNKRGGVGFTIKTPNLSNQNRLWFGGGVVVC